jgi:DnaK suppressor protein
MPTKTKEAMLKKVKEALESRKSATPKKKATTKKEVKAITKKTVAAKKSVKKGAPKKKTTAAKAKATKVSPKVKATAKKTKSTQIVKKTTTKKPVVRTSGAVVVAGINPYTPKKTEKYMSAKMQEHFKDILLKWKQQLMEEVDRTVHHMQDDANNFPDPSDRATQEEEFSLELRTRDRERKLIAKINDALRYIDEGVYGYCEMCGEEIGIRRLEARPTATLCIDCKTLDELREKHMA